MKPQRSWEAMITHIIQAVDIQQLGHDLYHRPNDDWARARLGAVLAEVLEKY